jgi:hypothetical protein
MTSNREINSFRDRLLNELSKLTAEEKAAFDRIYKIWRTSGTLNAPKEMYEWIEKHFGSVEAVEKQDFIKISNAIMYEGSVFNELRMNRPQQIVEEDYTDLMLEIEASKSGPFEHPLTGTPEDTFGRITGKYCITASNIAKYDSLHGLIIFNESNPLLFSRERVNDYFNVAQKWFAKAHESNVNAIYPMYTWNCLWRAGASMIHGHSQLVLTEGQAYSKIEKLRYLSLRYQEKYRTNYFEDVYSIHKNLGLGMEENGVKIISSLTPIKEKELIIISDSFDDVLANAVSDILNVYKDELNVNSFNLAIILPPMSPTPEVWQHVPIIVNIVDRGSLTNKTNDIAAMELYAQNIIGSNPYTVFKTLKKGLYNLSK